MWVSSVHPVPQKGRMVYVSNWPVTREGKHRPLLHWNSHGDKGHRKTARFSEMFTFILKYALKQNEFYWSMKLCQSRITDFRWGGPVG